MKRYLIEITTYNDGTKDGYGVYPYDTEDEAVAAFHGKMRGAIVNPAYETELCLIIDGNGNVMRFENWARQNA